MNDEEIPGHLPRGRACQACRNRKMKCDGNQPICNQCMRFNRENECMFVPGPAPSNSRMLEQEIRRLENQIRQLELRGGRIQAGDATLSSPLPSTSWWEPVEPPHAALQALYQAFLPHAVKFGFFLDMHRFLSSLATTHTGNRVPAALRNAVYLWGVHVIPSQRTHEDIFLNRALQSLPEALHRPTDVLYAMQAEILLAYYFFDSNRLLEGQQHVTGALSLARSCKLHKTGPGLHALNASLPPPLDSIEEQERINAWWQLFALEKAWTAASDAPSLIIEERADSVIDTPWPRDPKGNQSTYGQTVQRFMTNVTGDRTNEPLAYYAKAALLYERATYVSSVVAENVLAGADVRDLVANLDTSIEYFKRAIPVVGHPDTAPPAVRHHLLVIHTLVQCSTIALHKGTALRDMASFLRCVTAANTIASTVNAIPLENIAPVNPILAITASSAHEVLVSAWHMSRTFANAAPGLPDGDVLLFGLGVLKKFLAHFAGVGSPLFISRLNSVHVAEQALPS